MEEKNNYRFRIERFEAKNDKFNKTKQKLEEEVRKLHQTVEDYRNENTALKDQLNSFIEDNKQFAHRVLELEHQTEDLLNALEMIRGEKKRMIGDMQAIEEELDEKERSRKDYLERIRGLSQKLEEEESAKQALEKSLDASETQVSNYKRSAQELMDKVTFTKEVCFAFRYFASIVFIYNTMHLLWSTWLDNRSLLESLVFRRCYFTVLFQLFGFSYFRRSDLLKTK